MPFASHWSKRGAPSRLSWWTAFLRATGRAGLSRTGFRGTVSRCSRGTVVWVNPDSHSNSPGP